MKFVLSKAVVNRYKNIQPPFGFNGLGELVYVRTYSRVKSDGTNEQWFETVERVVNGTYSVQKRHIVKHGLGWDEQKAQRSAEEMFDRMFHMKFLPPGRGLWAMGTDIVEEKGLGAALNNCAFVSTDNLSTDLTKPFEFLMDMSMLGVGVGFDVEGAGSLTIYQPLQSSTTYFTIPDTREGWVESVKLLLLSYFQPNMPEVTFDYTLIRPKGELIKTFGGKASGPQPLRYLHQQLRDKFNNRNQDTITVTDIVDVMNMIGACVVAGNVRRTAEIAFGNPHDSEYLNLKNYRWNNDLKQYEGPMAHRSEYGWTSNNTVNCYTGLNYAECGERTGVNGEPGYAWLQNMRAYGRMCEPPNWSDKKAKGANPCAEQTLESFELCCLVETFPTRHDSIEDFLRTLKFAYLYAKTVTLINTHWEETNRVMLRNRRIGTSMSGIAQFVDTNGIDKLKLWCSEGYEAITYYDTIYSDWFCVPQSKKKTSIKPSGTVSLLPGVTPGMHWPEDIYCIRRVTLSKESHLVQKCIEAGYHVEPDVVDSSSVKVEIPVKIEGVRTVSQVDIWEQVSMAAFLQKYWADNQVSCTVTFKPDLTEDEKHQLATLQQINRDTEEENRRLQLLVKKAQSEASQIQHILNYFQYQLKGISFLPKIDGGAYAQMPYEGITKQQYLDKIANIKPLNLSGLNEDSTPEKFCDGDHCAIT